MAGSGWTSITLPNAKWAYIPQPPTHPKNKLKDYALHPDHEEGGSKAIWFRDCLGIVRDDWKFLHDQIIERVPEYNLAGKPDIKIVPDPRPELRIGLHFEVNIPIDGRNDAQYPVLTVWRFDTRLTPWLVTLYPP